MKLFPILPILLFTVLNGCTQIENLDKKVGGYCENCKVIFEYGLQTLKSIDTLPDYDQSSQKLKITGIIYQLDGKTPAANVLLYIYHTNENGKYIMKKNANNANKKHVHHRGWVRTKENGKYTFYTFLPGSYPNRNDPKHIHPLIKEEGKSVYYLDEFVFDSDPLLTKTEREKLKNRGGSGILKLTKKGDLLMAHRNIILGLNIPDY